MKLIADWFTGGLSQTPSSQAATPTGKQESHSSNVLGANTPTTFDNLKKLGGKGFRPKAKGRQKGGRVFWLGGRGLPG